MKLSYQYMTIFFTFPPTSNHLHLPQVENCGSNSRLVVDEDDNDKFRLERVKHHETWDVYVKMTRGKWVFNIYFSGDRQKPSWFWYGCLHRQWQVESDCLIYFCRRLPGTLMVLIWMCTQTVTSGKRLFIFFFKRSPGTPPGFDIDVYMKGDTWKVIVIV